MGFLNWLRGEQPGIIESIRNYENKGQFGEYLTDYALGHDNIPGRSRTFKNLYIPNRGQTTEIDVLMLHEKGIFVFESKNYSGWIFGSEDQRQWTQSFRGGTKERFYNPILQNRTHLKALQAYLELPADKLHSYIVFSERCELMKVPRNTNDYTIVRTNYLVTTLKYDLKARTPIFDETKLNGIAAKLEQAHKTDELVQQHISDVKALSKGEVCPFCGGKLVNRKGKYGAFIGCSNYPRCRFTRK